MKNSPAVPEKKRIVYMDLLRIFSAFGIVILHSAAMFWYNRDPASFEWQVFNFYDAVTRWTVPVFVMLSGALFLDKEIPLKKLYGKYILRMFIAYVFWSVAYIALYRYAFGDQSREFTLINIISGHSHLWYVPMTIGLYMLTPVLRRIRASRQATVYFLILFTVFAIAVPQLVRTLALYEERFKSATTAINGVTSKLSLSFMSGYIGYFLLGYHITHSRIKRPWRIVIYILGLISAAATVIVSSKLSIRFEKGVSLYYENLTLNVMLTSIAVLTFFKHAFGKLQPGRRAVKVIAALSKYTFGVYLVHRFVLDALHKFLAFNPLTLNPIASIPLSCLATFVISMFISFILNHIPLLKKYIV